MNDFVLYILKNEHENQSNYLLKWISISGFTMTCNENSNSFDLLKIDKILIKETGSYKYIIPHNFNILSCLSLHLYDIGNRFQITFNGVIITEIVLTKHNINNFILLIKELYPIFIKDLTCTKIILISLDRPLNKKIYIYGFNHKCGMFSETGFIHKIDNILSLNYKNGIYIKNIIDKRKLYNIINDT